jgi:hypothetical protein
LEYNLDNDMEDVQQNAPYRKMGLTAIATLTTTEITTLTGPGHTMMLEAKSEMVRAGWRRPFKSSKVRK